MSDEKRIALVKGLLEQTDAGKLSWEETTDEDYFQVAFPKYVVVIAKREYSDGDVYHFVLIRNAAGKVVDSIDYQDIPLAFEDPRDLLKGLYEKARRRASGVEAAIDEILSDLKKDDED